MSPSHVYTKHPLLANPLKWLRGVKKRHVPNLYLDTYYDPKTISSNPFLNSLASTRSDVSRSRFPTGNMIQMVVKTSQNSPNEKYSIQPVLHKPESGHNPASYVIGNKSYVSYAMKKRFMPVPSNVRHRSPNIMRHISISKTFDEDVELLLRNSFTELLTQYKPKPFSEGNGILLKPSTSSKIEWDHRTPVVYTDLVESDTFLDYTQDKEICSMVIKLIGYLT